MPVEVIMPKVDMDMATGRIAAWHVSEGEAVSKGVPLFDIETDKAAMEVESPAAGRLHHVLPAGAEVPIGEPVAWIYAEGEKVGAPPVGAGARTAAEEGETTAGPERTLAVPGSDSGHTAAVEDPGAHAAETPRATPLARRLARQEGLLLSAIQGRGPRGRISRTDVEATLAARTAQPAPDAAVAPPTSWLPETGPLALRRSGAGSAAPLFLIHGLASDASGWRDLDPFLPKNRPVLKLDLPGHGRSPRRRVGSFRDLARAVVDAFDAADIDRAHLVGHSLGGALALALADVRPRRIASLTLIAPAGLGPEIDGDAIHGIARARSSESLAPWLKRLTASPQNVGWDYVQAAMLLRADPALRSAQADLAQMLFPDGVQAFDLTAALGRLELPAKIIWGRADRIIPWRHALLAPGRVALHLLEGVGHMPHVEAPAMVGALLQELATLAGGNAAAGH